MRVDTDSSSARPDLRMRKAAVTRDMILDALVEIVVEGGLPGFSVQEVADRAGVSHRTVYRYFPTREALLEGLVTRTEEPTAGAGGTLRPDDADALPDVVRRTFAAFDHLADLHEAGVRFRVGAKVDEPHREQRTEAFARIVRDRFPHLDEGQAGTVAAIVRLLASSQSWLALRADARFTGEAAGAATSWAIEILLDAVSAHRDPPPPGPAASGTSKGPS